MLRSFFLLSEQTTSRPRWRHCAHLRQEDIDHRSTIADSILEGAANGRCGDEDIHLIEGIVFQVGICSLTF